MAYMFDRQMLLGERDLTLQTDGWGGSVKRANFTLSCLDEGKEPSMAHKHKPVEFDGGEGISRPRLLELLRLAARMKARW